MKKLLLFSAVVATAGMLASSASAASIATLSNGIHDPGETVNGLDAVDRFQVGDKIFGNFSWAPTSGSPLLGANVDISGVGTVASGPFDPDVPLATDFYGILISGAIKANAGQTVNYRLQYTVSVAPGAGYLLAAIAQSSVFGSVGGGTITIVENAYKNGFGLGHVGDSTVGFAFPTDDPEDPAQELSYGDNIVLSEQVSKLWIVKDIGLTGGAGAVEASEIFQRFVQVPTPDSGSTLVLLGSALGCLSLLSLRRKSR